VVLRVVDTSLEPLSVPLREPFVIASGRIDATRAALVSLTLEDTATGRTACGLGEAAALPPVTDIDQPELLRALDVALRALQGRSFGGHAGLADVVSALGLHPVARAAVESALLFAWAGVLEVPMHRLLGTSPDDDPVFGFAVQTDITLPIAAPEHMAALAVRWRAQGFTSFKVKVGRDEAWGGATVDEEALTALAAALPRARVRLDGNAGQTRAQAEALFHHALRAGLVVELLEQPTAAGDDDALVALSTRLPVPVVADESVKDLDDAARLIDAGVTGVNLKLVKHGGPLGAARVGRFARRRRVALMTGAMVETRVGLAAMLHVARALSSSTTPPLAVDLDTAFLLAHDPFVGGYRADGATLHLLAEGPRRR
jgi:L-alanine-DL-glutamate epimerase-like enolase superfamily enzyme